MDHEHDAEGLDRGHDPAEHAPLDPVPVAGEPASQGDLPYISDGEPYASEPRWETTAPTPPVTEPQESAGPSTPSAAWTTEAPTGGAGASAAPPPYAPGAPVEPTGTRKRSGARTAFVGGIAGALVGALVAGGLLVAFDDDPSPQPVRTETAATAEDVRPATQVVEPGNIRSILDAARPAVVRIDVDAPNGAQGTGTGFIVDPNGVIVTNAHVVQSADSVTVHLPNGDSLDGKVIGSDPRLDLAIVKIDRTGLPTLELGDSNSLQVGDGVVAIGNALGISEGSGATVTTGIISGLDRVVDVGDETLFNAIQTDAAINPGNSGGPLVDMNGKVIGINTAIANPQEANNVGFAISISSARPVIDALRAGRQPQIAFLGVTTKPLSQSQAQRLNVDSGAVVAQVSNGSGADKAGMKTGDVVVEIDGSKVTSAEDVASEVRKHSPGDAIDVVVVRDGQRQTVKVTLSDRPDDN
jgi:S1-C subfamily serine protease